MHHSSEYNFIIMRYFSSQICNEHTSLCIYIYIYAFYIVGKNNLVIKNSS